MANYSEASPASSPQVPDHSLVRRIGKGAYGEVWLARGVTGSLRAVKIVRRSDFDDDRTFEREFEGIRAYEPLSRNHRGLVQVLHIGRNDEEGFYYYVMELGDDVQGSPASNTIEYEPRTLRSDVLRKTRLPVAYCVQVGHVLAEALGYLHEQGLAHRDIKPSNVIFVGGVPKLADIGLVARSGQRTYVGTQGFTPPEGPGAPQADVYSLGMVLYEISTGKDRLDFPEVPDALPEEEREDWRRLNNVVCRACDPEVKARYADGAELAADLAVLAAGDCPAPLPSRWRKPLLAGVAGVLAVASLLAFWPTPPPPVAAVLTRLPAEAHAPSTGSAKFSTIPQGADILIDGEVVGVTPHTVPDLPPGRTRFTLEREGYRTRVVDVDIVAGQMAVLADELEFYQPPVAGKPWTNQLGMEFAPSGRNHTGVRPVAWSEFRAFAESEGKASTYSVVEYAEPGRQRPVKIVLATAETAERFCAWMLQRGRNLGFLGPEHYYSHARSDVVAPAKSPDGKELTAFICSVRSFLYGSLRLLSVPDGADVYEAPSHRYLGKTPLELPQMLPGKQTFEFRLEGHENIEMSVAVKAEETHVLTARMQESRGVVFSRVWHNSLGMKLVPYNGMLVAAWETRVADWQAYRAATGADAAAVGFRQLALEPVAGVSRTDAREFCEWLTATERMQGLLQQNHRYRLPRDAEWSAIAGIREPSGRQPYQLDALNKEDFPWGAVWPPPAQVGNFADESARVKLPKGRTVITGYRDGYAQTAPVGSFFPNAHGIHDLGGNVWEWVDDDYGGAPENPASTWAVCRGGSWADGKREQLLGSMRNIVREDYRGDGIYGFRVLLERMESDVAPASAAVGAAPRALVTGNGRSQEGPP